MGRRVEEFTQAGENFIYIDFSGLKSDDEFLEVMNQVEPIMKKYPEHSVNTITNIANLRFDSHTKEITVKYMSRNAPYVKQGVLIGMDGIKKMMAVTIMKLSGRSNFHFAYSKEGAIEWVLAQKG